MLKLCDKYQLYYIILSKRNNKGINIKCVSKTCLFLYDHLINDDNSERIVSPSFFSKKNIPNRKHQTSQMYCIYLYHNIMYKSIIHSGNKI